MENNNKTGLYQNQEQSLSLLPQQLQTIRLISLNSTEIEHEIQKALEENPALEENTKEDFDDNNSENEDLDIGDYATTDDIPEYKLRQLSDRNQKREEIPFAATAPNLIDFIIEQIDMMSIDQYTRDLAKYIVGNMSDDGYIRISTEEIENDLFIHKLIQVSPQEIENAISIIQRCDPKGVGARNLKECLLLQLKKLDDSNQIVSLATKILQEEYEAFTNKNFEKLKNHLSIDNETLSEVYSLISHLNPKPGASIGDQGQERLSHYNPDFIVSVDENDNLQLTIVGEREVAPLRISQSYADMLGLEKKCATLSPSEKNAQQFVKHKIEQAKWFIEAINQRQRTLRITMQSIMSRQYFFFLSGEDKDLSPMILKDVANDTGLDISTISRVTSSKSVQTDFGVFPLKHLFSESISTTNGQEVSNKEVKAILREIIEKEDPSNPLSDNIIVSKLEKKGYNISRRTVAKYRDEMNIPTAKMRKQI